MRNIAKSSQASLRSSQIDSESDPMLIEERRQYILSIAQSEGRVRVRALSKSLGISQITVRKDLDYLQMKGLLQRSHGGALPIQTRRSVRSSSTREGKESSH